MRSKRSLFGTVSLSLASLLAISTSSGCSKLEELTGEKKEEAKTEEGKSGDAGEAKADGEQPEAAEADGGEVAEAEVEPIPVEELTTGLDLMLKLVPADSEFLIARDATVVADYVEEATRFLDGPMTILKSGPMAEERDLKELDEGFEVVKAKNAVVKAALDSSGIQLAEGAAIFQDKSGETMVVFNAPDPEALVIVGKATGVEEFADLKCKAIETVPGFNVCGENQAAIDAYTPTEDPIPLRTSMAGNLPGVDLDEANLVAHVNKGSNKELFVAVSTIPGMVHMAIQAPADKEMLEAAQGFDPGEAKLLAQVEPGAGFIWGRASQELLAEPLATLKGTPVEAAGKSLTGEFMLAGSVDPGGVVLQMGTTDTAGLEGLMTLGFELGKGEVPPELPQVPGSKVTFEQVDVAGGGNQAKALHLNVAGVPETDVLKTFTGLHPDAWAFASNDVFTLAVGPDQEDVGKLLDVTSGGPSADTLAALPPALAEGLGRNEVGLIVHMPMDFLHGAQMHSLVRASLKDIPEAQPEQVLALAGLVAPFSSATLWVAEVEGKPVAHVAVQAIGNRATDEGRAALDAAHTVADGGDPAAAFASVAAAYRASPMAWAYKTRAGLEGPGYMVGSGLGAVLATAAVAVPVVLGKSNQALADDLGVDPDAPEPELTPTTKPKPQVTKPVKKQPKKDPPKTDDTKTDDTKTDDTKTDDTKTDDTKTDDTKTDDTKGPRRPKFGKRLPKK